jgi:hypothetical protein
MPGNLAEVLEIRGQSDSIPTFRVDIAGQLQKMLFKVDSPIH